MKKYDKSKIMKLAHHMRKYEGYSKSAALTLAWDEARRNEHYWIIIKRNTGNNARVDRTSATYQNMMSSYYANHTYNGD